MLKDKVIVITGSSGLLGKTFSKTVLKNGGICILSDNNSNSLVEFEKELIEEGFDKARFHSIVVDITNEISISQLIVTVHSKFGKIDAIVNNAYPHNSNYGKKLEDVTYNDFNENVSIHLGGYFECMKQFSIYFKKQGCGNVLSMSSVYGIMAPRFEIYEGTDMTMPVEYAAIKSAIINLTKYFSKYYKGTGIRFNCLCPGGNKRETHDSEFLKKYNQYGMTKGMLDKEDLTGALIFLLSDYSKMINGQNIVVDDGWSL
jgi:NAD(P)-dependent dehydrogenase (short-subunit alcohol dehydrogenase family)